MFNADNSRLLGIETPKGSRDYLVTLYGGDGKLLKTLFTRREYDWAVAGPSGLSLNEKGDRLLLRMTDKSVRTYRLPGLDDESVCEVAIPDGWYANRDKLRFTGHKDYFAITLEQKQPLPEGASVVPPFTRIYDGVTGKLFHTLDTVNVGHHDFSSDGKLAYVEGFNQGRDMNVRVVNLDGTCTVGDIGFESSGTIDQCMLFLK